MIKKKMGYFTNYWNYIEAIPSILILANILRHRNIGIKIVENVYFWNVQAIAALFMWGKFLYFLRSFEATGYLIRSLGDVFKDM
jgi:hypothetical protein